MTIKLVFFFLMAIGLTFSNASAAKVSGKERDAILEACRATHDACLVACNAQYDHTKSALADGLHRFCTNDCDSTARSCEGSVDLRGKGILDQTGKKPSGGVVAPE